jgi:diguanylate cyclase (GGDEF)-like protein
MGPISILVTGAIILACGCAGLLMVRFSNPRLLGLGWLGAAMGTGGVGATLLLLDPRYSPVRSVVLADLLVLASMSLLHLAVMEVVGLSGLPRFAFFLLALQAGADLFKVYAGASGRFRITVIGLLIAAQATQTAMLLLRRAPAAIQVPARFVSAVLVGFIGWNLLRSFATATGLLSRHTSPGHPLISQVQSFTFVLYLAVALGLAFGFFWMTTAGLTARLEDLASTDPLTGILNRRAFLRHLEDEFIRCQRASGSFALLMVDIDHFKRVNDTHGHSAGDEVLCAAVQNLRDAIRGIDLVGRWGGEEFVVLLPGADEAAAHIVAQRIRLNVQRPALLGDKLKHIPITASLGIALGGSDGSIEEILCRVDAALYRAKSAGRNCVIGPTPHPLPVDRREGNAIDLTLVVHGQTA